MIRLLRILLPFFSLVTVIAWQILFTRDGTELCSESIEIDSALSRAVFTAALVFWIGPLLTPNKGRAEFVSDLLVSIFWVFYLIQLLPLVQCPVP